MYLHGLLRTKTIISLIVAPRSRTKGCSSTIRMAGTIAISVLHRMRCKVVMLGKRFGNDGYFNILLSRMIVIGLIRWLYGSVVQLVGEIISAMGKRVYRSCIIVVGLEELLLSVRILLKAIEFFVYIFTLPL